MVREARGPRLHDFSGREYIDYILGSGPLVLGHAHPAVVAAVRGAAPQGHDVLPAQRAHPRAGGGDLPRGAVRRAGAVLRQRQRGDVLRAAGRARLPPARQDPQVRGRLPRHPRLLPDERGPALAQGVPGPHAGLGGHPARHPGGGPDRAVQRPGRGRGHHRRAPPRSRRGDHGAVPAADRAAARLPPGRAGDHRAARRSRWSSTRSSPASASPTAAPRSTTAWCPTWPPSARSSAAASRSPRWRGGADIMRHFSHELDGTRSTCSRRARSTATRSRPRRPRHAGRAAPARRLRAPLRHRHAAQAGARGGGPQGGTPGPGGGRGAGVRDLLHRPAHHRLPGHPHRGPRPSRRVHARDALRRAW